jgi:pyruvate dehydrogenase E2 component (dihydrolipoamide acetyltransferase)
MFDVTAFTAIITPPQVAILATARPVERCVIANDVLARSSVMTATLSADHRAIDGGDAARFLETFKEAMEDPDTLLAERPNPKEPMS